MGRSTLRSAYTAASNGSVPLSSSGIPLLFGIGMVTKIRARERIDATLFAVAVWTFHLATDAVGGEKPGVSEMDCWAACFRFARDPYQRRPLSLSRISRVHFPCRVEIPNLT